MRVLYISLTLLSVFYLLLILHISSFVWHLISVSLTLSFHYTLYLYDSASNTFLLSLTPYFFFSNTFFLSLTPFCVSNTFLYLSTLFLCLRHFPSIFDNLFLCLWHFLPICSSDTSILPLRLPFSLSQYNVYLCLIVLRTTVYEGFIKSWGQQGHSLYSCLQEMYHKYCTIQCWNEVSENSKRKNT